MRILRILAASLLLIPLLFPSATYRANAATPVTGSEVRIFSVDGKQISSFQPFKDIKNSAAGSVVATDLGTDGVSEIIIGAGANTAPLVRVFRQDGSKINEFLAYDKNFKGGVNIAACDLDHDGKAEIVTGAGFGGGPHIRIFTSEGVPTGAHFFAYESGFRGGVTLACADVDGDGENEIVTGQGVSGGNTVKVFSSTGSLESEMSVDTGSERSGTNVTVGNIDTDPELEILAMPMNYGKYDLTVIDHAVLGYNKFTKPSGFVGSTYGSSVTVLNSEIYLANGAFLVPQVAKIGGTTTFPPFDGNNGYNTLLSRLSEKNQLVALSSPSTISSESSGKYIKVDLSEQRLTAYENGIQVKTFLVSTGKPGFSTPIAKTKVLAKIPVMTYAWNYGPGNPNNYSLPGVKWNMRILPHIYIHSAYWHNNFGRVMSHGCVNTSIPDAEWAFNWATVGTAVEIVK